MIDATLQQELERQKNRTGLIGTRLEVQETQGNSLSAHITKDWRSINISYGQDLNLVPDAETERFVEKKKIANPELVVGSDLLHHEAGHRENPVGTRLGCPRTIAMHDAIKESVHNALEAKGKKGVVTYVTNAFEDVLDNINCRQQTDFAGQTLFWNNQGLVNSQDGTYAPFYEAFVRINLVLGGNVVDSTLLRRFYGEDEAPRRAARAVLGEFKQALGLERVIKLHEKPGFQTLFTTDEHARETLWTRLAHSFATHTADLLDEQPRERMFGAGEGEGKGAPEDGDSSSSGSGSENPFDKAMRDPRNRQEVALGRYEAGKGPALHRDVHEQLYDLYKKISKEVVVRTSTYTEAMSMPLVHYGRRFAQEGERKFRYKGIGVNQEGELAVKTTRHAIEHPVAYKTHPRQFPKFKLALMDNSGTMGGPPKKGDTVGSTAFIPWGDNSKKHYALKGYFGVENYFERQGIAPYVENCVLGYSGEAPIKGTAKEVAKRLMTTPGGGTSMDVDGLEAQLSDDSLVLSISDGELSLSDDEKERLERKLSGPSRVDFAHIQIGGETAFSLYLHSIGVPVFKVQGDDDLAATMIDFVAGYYKQVRGKRE